MKRCNSFTKRGTLCRCEATHGDYCEWHVQRPTISGEVTDIPHKSKELRTGQVVYEKAKRPRPGRELKFRKWWD